MKKRLLALLLAGAMCVGLAACGDNSSANSQPPANTQSQGGGTQGGGDSAELTINDVWPSGTTVTFNVPAKAGGGTDLYTRYLTAALGEVVPGVNFVVNNYDTSEVGMETTKNADPDGLTLATYHGGAIVQYLTGTSNINVREDYKTAGVMNLGGPQTIMAKPNAPYKNFKELAEYIKAHPGEVVIGCSLGGTTQMIFTSLVETLTGDASMATYVQCSSEADKLTQAASGSIDIANCTIPNGLAYEADGKLTILGTIGPEMANMDNMKELTGLDLTENFKTAPEQGVDATWDSNYYIGVPAGTPDNVVKVINEAIMKAVEVPSFVEGNKQMATYTGVMNYEEATKAMEKEWAFMDALVDGMGLKTR